MYARVDRLVGDVLEGVGDRTDVIVVSDHGWEYDGTGHLNFNPGTFVAAGPSFRRGARVADISVLDVLPLVLAILEIPLSRDLDGHVPVQVFADWARPEIRWVDEHPVRAVSLPESVVSEAPDDREMLERLRGLGYVE